MNLQVIHEHILRYWIGLEMRALRIGDAFLASYANRQRHREIAIHALATTPLVFDFGKGDGSIFPVGAIIRDHDMRMSHEIMAQLAMISPENLQAASGYGVIQTTGMPRYFDAFSRHDFIRHEVQGRWLRSKRRSRITGAWPTSRSSAGTYYGGE